MRIVQTANFVHDTSGGVRIAIDAIGARYVAAGHEVMTIRPGSRHHLERDPSGRVRVELPGLPLPGSGGYRAFVRRAPVAALIASWRPDVVEVHDTTTLTWVGAYAGRLGATAAMFAHERLGLVLGDHLGAGDLMTRAAARHQQRALAGFDVAFAPSVFGAAELGNVTAVRIVPLGVDLELFRPERRHEITRPERPRRIVLASRLSREKEPLLAVHAVQALRWRGLDVELVVAGAGPLHSEMVQAGRHGGVRMLGHLRDRSHLAALLADAEAVICPGPRETFGLAALEALASGTPVVCVDRGAIPELLVDGAGVARSPDPAGLADGLEAVLDGDRQAWRRAARRRAEHFTWDRTAEAMLGAYADHRSYVRGPT